MVQDVTVSCHVFGLKVLEVLLTITLVCGLQAGVGRANFYADKFGPASYKRQRTCECNWWKAECGTTRLPRIHNNGPLTCVHQAFRDHPARYPTNLVGVAEPSNEQANWLSEGFTIVISTFRRDSCLQVIVPHYLSCQPKQLRIVWHDFSRQYPSWLAELSQNGSIVIDNTSSDSLANRWVPQDFATRAVFSVDDDVMHQCGEVQAAHAVWQRHPFQLVGFAARLIEDGGCYFWKSSFLNWPSNKANTLFITKGGFAHSAFYELLWLPEFTRFRDKVAKLTTAEDILMSFVHAAHVPHEFAKPVPLLPFGPQDFQCGNRSEQKSGLAQTSGSMTRRCSIIKELREWFGKEALRKANVSDFYVYDRELKTFGRNMRETCGGSSDNATWHACLQFEMAKIQKGSFAV